ERDKPGAEAATLDGRLGPARQDRVEGLRSETHGLRGPSTADGGLAFGDRQGHVARAGRTVLRWRTPSEQRGEVCRVQRLAGAEPTAGAAHRVVRDEQPLD